MSRKNNEKFIVFVVTVAAVGLVFENLLMGWEFWVPVVILAGIVSLWAVNFSDRIDYGIRKVFYFSSAALLVFYHGIHKTSLFDSALVVAFVMMIFTLFNSGYMMNILLIEYFVILFIHFINLFIKIKTLDYILHINRKPFNIISEISRKMFRIIYKFSQIIFTCIIELKS